MKCLHRTEIMAIIVSARYAKRCSFNFGAIISRNNKEAIIILITQYSLVMMPAN